MFGSMLGLRQMQQQCRYENRLRSHSPRQLGLLMDHAHGLGS
jgi:hypothetical protein